VFCVADEVHATDKIRFVSENEDLDVNEGHKSLQWVVSVTASSKPTLVWYGPNCSVLEETDGPSKHDVRNAQLG
jgi:hypothetical protein